MDQVMGKVGSFWVGQKAKGELGSVGNEINTITNNIDGGAKWLVNKIKGKMQKSLQDLLKEHNMPAGLFPAEAVNYEFNEETKFLTVEIPTICEIYYKDSSMVRLNTTITGYLEKGSFTHVEGMKTKVMFIWVKVTAVSSDVANVHFQAGMKKSRGRGVYEVLEPGVPVLKF